MCRAPGARLPPAAVPDAECRAIPVERGGVHRAEREPETRHDRVAPAIDEEAEPECPEPARVRTVLRPEARLDARLDADAGGAEAEREHRVRDVAAGRR